MTTIPRAPRVGIAILNYHQPESTVTCLRRLREVEGSRSVLLWIENDALVSGEEPANHLSASGLPWQWIDPDIDELPAEGTIGVIRVPENLGYAGGNNIGLRFLHRRGVEYAWVMNNDTYLVSGSSSDFVAAAQAQPDVGLWGATLISPDGRRYSGASLRLKDFNTIPIHGHAILESDPLSYVSGCSLFFRLELAARIGFIPDSYFLYYEDPAFSQEIRRLGYTLSAVDTVEIHHDESLSVGHRSPLMEYYSRRNRWAFIQKYFPGHLRQQRRGFWYRTQSLVFRGAFRRILVEWLALRDWENGMMGRTERRL